MICLMATLSRLIMSTVHCRSDKFTPSGNVLSIEYGLYAPVVGLLIFVHLNDPIP